MNVYTGEVRDLDTVSFADRLKYKECVLPLTTRQRLTKKIGRNDACPCGSGKKFKQCCLKGGTP